MIDQLIAYVRHACPDAFLRPIDEEQEKSIGYRSLPTLATLPLGGDLSQSVIARLNVERQRVGRYQALERHLREVTRDAASAIKGSRFSALYPDGVLRYQGDLDLLVVGEPAYISCIEKLLEIGLVQKSSHLTLARDGKHYASSIFFEPLEDGLPGPASIYVELHLRGFPITPLSYLDMTSATFAKLSSENQNALTYIAELAHRYSKFGHFTHRDVIDSILIFSKLRASDLELLRGAIDANVLWVSLALLGKHLRPLAFPGLPQALLGLINDARAAMPPDPFDLFEHQAWPFCRSGGMSRAEYEYIHHSYAEINPPWDQGFNLTPFEVGLRFGRGVPIAMQITPTLGCTAILDSCSLLAGPPNARITVHTRIGDTSPIRPQLTLGPST